MNTVTKLSAAAILLLCAGQVIASPNPHMQTGQVATYNTDSCKKAHAIHRDKLKAMAAEHCEVEHKSVLDRFRYRAEGCDFITRGKPPTLVIGGIKFSCK